MRLICARCTETWFQMNDSIALCLPEVWIGNCLLTCRRYDGSDWLMVTPLSLSINYQYMEKGLFELIPAHTARGGGVHLGQMSLLHGWHLDNHSHSQVTTIGNLSVGTACLTCMSSGCGRRGEHSEESNADIVWFGSDCESSVVPVAQPRACIDRHSLTFLLFSPPHSLPLQQESSAILLTYA